MNSTVDFHPHLKKYQEEEDDDDKEEEEGEEEKEGRKTEQEDRKFTLLSPRLLCYCIAFLRRLLLFC